MPEAVKFNALGAGNGFPFCLPKVDVSGYDYWTSLSGWSKVDTPVDDAAKVASIKESRQMAMALFWNAYEVKGLVTSSIDNLTTTRSGFYDPEPKERVCLSRFSDTNSGSQAEFSINIDIKALYNSSEFVGYGVNRAAQTFSFDFYDVNVDLLYRANDPTPDPDRLYDIDYTTLSHPTLGDMHFVCSASIFGLGPSGTVDAVNRTATSGTTSGRIDSIDFWTYPA